MKALILAVAVASALATPIAAFAQQTDAPQTRAEVRADLIQLEHAGYRPTENDSYYPRKLELAEQAVGQEGGTMTDYEGAEIGTGTMSTSGHVSFIKPAAVYAHDATERSIYFGH